MIIFTVIFWLVNLAVAVGSVIFLVWLWQEKEDWYWMLIMAVIFASIVVEVVRRLL